MNRLPHRPDLRRPSFWVLVACLVACVVACLPLLSGQAMGGVPLLVASLLGATSGFLLAADR